MKASYIHDQQTLMSSQQFNSKGYNYGFVEFDDPGAAERAMQTLNGRRIHQSVGFL
jgi:nucleolysin TIA-1/TIAR